MNPAWAGNRSVSLFAMNITVRTYNELKPITGSLPDGGRLTLADGETVGDVLRRLAPPRPQRPQPHRAVGRGSSPFAGGRGYFLLLPPRKRAGLVLFVNGRMAHPETRLADGDTLVFFSAIAGG